MNEKVPCRIAGKDFPSIAEAALFFGVDRRNMHMRIVRGLTAHAPVPGRRSGRPITIEGKTYISIAQAAEALGMGYSALYHKLQKGEIEHDFPPTG